MEPWRALGLWAVGIFGCVLIFFVVRRLEQDPVRDAVMAWATQSGKTTRGDGFSAPLEIVGLVGERWFTVSYDGNRRVLLIGLDCEAPDSALPVATNADRGPLPGEQRVQDDTLVTRWTRPTIEQIRQLDKVIEEMLVVAMGIEGNPKPEAS